jgi:hypothetical protein
VSARRHRRLTLRRAGIALASLALIAGASLVAPHAAQAVFRATESRPGYLVLHTQPANLYFPQLSPGGVAYGRVEVLLDDADTAELSIETFGQGALFDHPDGVTLITRLCEEEWVGVPVDGVGNANRPTCGGEVRMIGWLDTTVLVTDAVTSTALGEIHRGDPRYILVELRMPGGRSAPDESLMGSSGDFSMRITATGDADVTPGAPTPSSPSATPGMSDSPAMPGSPGSSGWPDSFPRPPGSLAATGVDILGVAFFALGAIALGLLSRRRRPSHEVDGPQ